MSAWRAKALELIPHLEVELLAAKDPLDVWRFVEATFFSAKSKKDPDLASACLNYAIWTLKPAPQARTLDDVSGKAAQLLHKHAAELHQWVSRKELMAAQKGLRFHLGDTKYLDFETCFFRKTEHDYEIQD